MVNVIYRGVTKRYDNGFMAVDGLDLEIDDGEFLVLLGPSGCGKSTLGRSLVNLYNITSGSVVYDDDNFCNIWYYH